MKTAREKISFFISHSALKRLLDEYENFDAASRLCADYCIDANEIARLIDEVPKRKRFKLRLTFAARPHKAVDLGEDMGEAYLMA